MAATVRPHLQLQLQQSPPPTPGPGPGPDADSVSLFETVDWSCCCCSRRTGVLVLGVSFLALSVAMLFLCSVEAARLQASLQPPTTNATPTLAPTAPKAANPPNMQPHPRAPLPGEQAKRDELRRLTTGVLWLVTAQAAVAAAGALSALLLLWGAWARRARALLPWMACAAAEVALLAVGALYCICASMSRKLPALGLDGFFALVVMFLFCVPVLYCLLAVGTFYRELTGSKYSACNTAVGIGGQPNGVPTYPAVTPPPTLSHPPPLPSVPPPKPSVPPPKRQAPRPPLHRLNSEGHENPAFQSTAF
ncbi:hypothetical protein R5R35_009776 [Gryllus longicercus]|uniref:Transmembrane protein n=1 Tax=Gryllus longicercus TaxID=2509291 RepID=A0AAN9Z7U3_9ORTH